MEGSSTLSIINSSMSVGEILHKGVFSYVYPRQYWWFLWNVKPDYVNLLHYSVTLLQAVFVPDLSISFNYCHLKMEFPDTSPRTWKQNNSLVCETRYWCFLLKKVIYQLPVLFQERKSWEFQCHSYPQSWPLCKLLSS